MTQTDYQRTGKVELNKGVVSIMLVTENGNPVLMNEDIYEFYFIEDIFKFCMVGKLVFLDRYNFVENGPFTGNEKIFVSYGIGQSERQLVFDIWKIGKISQAGGGIRETSEQMLEIYFVDPFFAGMNLRKYSKSWADESYTDIMKNILNDMVFVRAGGRPLNVEDGFNRTDFVMPYWTPQTALRWLMRRARSRRTGSSGYLCYNNTLQGFSTNLKTINYLMLDIDKTIDLDPYKLQSNVVSDKNKILEWWINSLDRTSLPTIRGGKWRGYNFKGKRLLQFDYRYSDAVNENVMLGRSTLYPQIDDTESSRVMAGDSDLGTLNDVAFSDWSKRYNVQFVLNLVVEGHESRFAGQQIDVTWPSIQAGQDKGKFNDAFIGKYLIKSVTHNFMGGGHYPYKQRLVCIKNAYHKINSASLYPSEVTNISDERLHSQVIIRS
jgi:hypothetical protein